MQLLRKFSVEAPLKWPRKLSDSATSKSYNWYLLVIHFLVQLLSKLRTKGTNSQHQQGKLVPFCESVSRLLQLPPPKRRGTINLGFAERERGNGICENDMKPWNWDGHAEKLHQHTKKESREKDLLRDCDQDKYERHLDSKKWISQDAATRNAAYITPFKVSLIQTQSMHTTLLLYEACSP